MEARAALFKNPAFLAAVMFFIDVALQVSGWQNLYVAWVLGAIALLLLALAVNEWLQLPASLMFSLSGLLGLSFRRTIPLDEAARAVYDALRDTAIRRFIDENFDSVDRKLRVMAKYIAHTEARLLAREPAGASLVPFDKSLLSRGRFHAGGREFKEHANQAPRYLDVSLNRGDLRRVINELKNLSADLPNQQGYI